MGYGMAVGGHGNGPSLRSSASSRPRPALGPPHLVPQHSPTCFSHPLCMMHACALCVHGCVCLPVCVHRMRVCSCVWHRPVLRLPPSHLPLTAETSGPFLRSSPVLPPAVGGIAQASPSALLSALVSQLLTEPGACFPSTSPGWCEHGLRTVLLGAQAPFSGPPCSFPEVEG